MTRKPNDFKHVPIEQALLHGGLPKEPQPPQLLVAQAQHKQRLGKTAVALGFVAEQEIAQFLAEFLRLPFAELGDADLAPSVVGLIPEELARRHCLIVMQKAGEVLTVAMADPLDVRAVDAVRVATGCRVTKVVCSPTQILQAIDRCYHASSRLAASMDELMADETTLGSAERAADHTAEVKAGSDTDQLHHQASDAPVVQFVNLLLMRAIQDRASDIHIEPQEHDVIVRLRVDGILREIAAPPKSMLQPITTRIKILSNLDIAERRLPQDGRFKFKVFEKTIDVRLSCLPTVFGEKLVLRILDRASLILDLQTLGFEPTMLEVFRRTLALPHGLVILTGPTGSGKTTTLYAALNAIRTPTKNIVTVEDPVEYQLNRINQVHTKPDIGLTFAAVLRSILRQDPDIIMVGEIRDRETADICIRAALTGHLVLSTLHTNDAVSAISRLVDMGIEPYLLTASLNLVMAQRLVRRICEECTSPVNPPEELLRRLQRVVKDGSERWNFRYGKGCSRCGKTGYFGRVAVYEQFVLTDRIKALISEGAKLHDVQQAARREGLQTLLESSLHAVRDGMTTLEEALSVCGTQAELFE